MRRRIKRRPKRHDKVCENPECRKPFKSHRSDARFHSEACYNAAWHKAHPRMNVSRA